MAKIATVLLVVAAFAVALWLIILRRPKRIGTGRFAALVAAFVAMLGGCQDQAQATNQGEKSQPAIADKVPAPKGETKPMTTDPKANRAQIRAELTGIASIKDGTGRYSMAKQAARDRLSKLLGPLVEAGELTQAGADVLVRAHADRVFHHLRKQATCYMVYPRIATRRDGVEKQLKLLTDAEKRGTLSPEVIAKSKLALGRGMELILHNQAIDERQAADPKAELTKAEQEMLDILNRSPKPLEEEDRIKTRPEVAEARDFLLALLSE